MSHAEADRAMSPHEDSGDSPRVPGGQGFEIRIDVRHQFFDHKVFPVTSHWRINVPGAPQRCSHIDRDKNELADHTRRDGSIEDTLGAALVEISAVALGRSRQKVDHWIALRGVVVAGRKINAHLPHRTNADLVLRKVGGLQFPAYKLTFRSFGKCRGCTDRSEQ